jgi:MFS transporter, DHA2 family, multidrug resistance protein
MSQPNSATTSDTKNINIPKYLIISLLTLFSFGPQYFLNLSYILNQIVIQNGLNLSTHDMLLPSVMSNLAFALGVPLGRILSGKYGLRRSYLTFIFIFLCGSIINIFSSGLISLIIGRTIQGLSAGMLFLTILPASLKSYPNKIRNLFLFFAIGGLFGSSAVGAFFGSLSLSTDAWRWLFILNIFSSILCLLMGYAVLPKQQPEQHENRPVNRMGVFLLSLV